MEWVMLGGLGAGTDLFSYNRAGFMFDKEQQIKREYQGMGMRIKQFELYREDVKDLVELTVAKMDNYLIINTLQLSFVVILFTEGRPHPGVWMQQLHWLFALCTVGAFLYFLLSVWLAMHASIAAHSFGVRLRTQFVRLPVPNREQLDAARAFATDYEKKEAGDMLRVPLWKQQMRRFNNIMSAESAEEVASEDDATSMAGSSTAVHPQHNDGDSVNLLKHVQLFRELQANWQSYDAYARVCMTMGTNQFLHAIGYYAEGMLISENKAPVPAFVCVMLFTVTAWLVMRLDLYLRRRTLALAAALIIIPPVLTMVSITIDISIASDDIKFHTKVLNPIVFLLHMMWIIFIMVVAKADYVNGIGLPTQFRAVTYLDVFGWLSSSPEANGSGDLSVAAANPARRPLDLADGPGIDMMTAIQEETASCLDDEATFGLRQVSAASEASSTGLGRPGLGLLPERQRSEGGTLRAESLRRTLVRACDKAQVLLEQLLGVDVWDSPDIRDHISDDAAMVQGLAQLREAFSNTVEIFETTKGTFSSAEPGGLGSIQSRSSLQSGLSGESQSLGQVWLKLNWNARGPNPVEFYLCMETKKTAWVAPQERRADHKLNGELVTFPEMCQRHTVMTEDQQRQHWASLRKEPFRVSSLATLEEQVRDFNDKVKALADFQPTERVPATSSMPAQPWSASGPAASSSSSDAAPLPRPATEAAAAGCPVEEAQRHDRPAQETRFACAEPSGYRDGFSSQAAASFFPAQDRERRGRTSRRPPGQLPWHTFCQGSTVLVVMWGMGVIWTLADSLGYDIPLSHKNTSAHRPDAMLNLQLVFDGAWPHTFFSPRGLACHPSAGDSLLIAEKYAVHEINLKSTAVGGIAQATTQHPALTRCLAAAPTFQVSGIQGITLDCSGENARCSALLFGSLGQGALRCALNPQSSDSITEVIVHGGPKWRALAAGADRETLWALGESSLVQLRPRSPVHQQAGQSEELVPELEIQHEAAENITQIHVLASQSEVLLTLDNQGLLRAWSMKGRDGPLMWKLNARPGIVDRWVGMCAVGGSLYVAGVSHNGRPPSIWRTQLPSWLQ